MKINFDSIRPMDYVLTTDISIFAGLCRWTNAGAGTFWNTHKATHAGCVVNIPSPINGENRYFIFEMKPTSIFNLKHASHLNSFDAYKDNGFWGERIVTIMRNPVYFNITIRDKANDRCIGDAYKTVDYDFKGLAEYWWPEIKDRPDKFYCSELLQHYAILDGGKIEGTLKEDDISPYGIQTAKNLIKVL